MNVLLEYVSWLWDVCSTVGNVLLVTATERFAECCPAYLLATLHSRLRENGDKILVKTIICTHLSLKHLSELSFLELFRVELSSQIHIWMLGSVLHAF